MVSASFADRSQIRGNYQPKEVPLKSLMFSNHREKWNEIMLKNDDRSSQQPKIDTFCQHNLPLLSMIREHVTFSNARYFFWFQGSLRSLIVSWLRYAKGADTVLLTFPILHGVLHEMIRFDELRSSKLFNHYRCYRLYMPETGLLYQPSLV